MARSRRRSPRRREKADWVYRGPVATPVDDSDTPIGDPKTAGLASYTQFVTTMNTGAINARFLVLYDSQNRLAHWAGTSTGVGGSRYGVLNRAARSEGRRARILATEGSIYIEPSTWAIGNVMAFGWRLGAWDQDPQTGLISLPAGYSMTQNVTLSTQDAPDVWANTYNWVREGRFFRGFNSNESNVFNLRIMWRGRRALRGNEAWGLYMEGAPTGVNVRLQPWLRTLVVDEG